MKFLLLIVPLFIYSIVFPFLFFWHCVQIKNSIECEKSKIAYLPLTQLKICLIFFIPSNFQCVTSLHFLLLLFISINTTYISNGIKITESDMNTINSHRNYFIAKKLLKTYIITMWDSKDIFWELVYVDFFVALEEKKGASGQIIEFIVSIGDGSCCCEFFLEVLAILVGMTFTRRKKQARKCYFSIVEMILIP